MSNCFRAPNGLARPRWQLCHWRIRNGTLRSALAEASVGMAVGGQPVGGQASSCFRLARPMATPAPARLAVDVPLALGWSDSQHL
jgi:hypothetical protein